MKRLILFTVLVIIMSSLLVCQDYDIRKLKWGMPFEDVKQAEALGEDFFKQEELLGISVDVRFGFDYKGLYSVIYSTRGKEFAGKASEVLHKKYGKSDIGLDYSFIMQSRAILNQHSEEVVNTYEKGDMSYLDKIKNSDERKLIRNLLTKQAKWEFGNTVALLLDSPDVGSLSYWAKVHHYENKKKFAQLLVDLKIKNKKNAAKKTDDTDKF